MKLHKLLILILIIQFTNNVYSDVDPKITEDCEAIIKEYDHFEYEFTINPNYYNRQRFSRITTIIEERSCLNDYYKRYFQNKISTNRFKTNKRNVLIATYKNKFIGAGILSSMALIAYKNRTGIANVLDKKSDFIVESLFKFTLPTIVISAFVYFALTKSSSYFTDKSINFADKFKQDSLELQKKQMNSVNKNLDSMNKSKAIIFAPGEIDENFESVAGAKEAKEELAEIVDYLRNPTKYENIGAKIPKGILLLGAPGNGKTLLARAVAGEANCNFIVTSGSEFDEKYIGVGAARVRDLFEEARKNAPCIVFIDEIDSIGLKRNGNADNLEHANTINQLLTEMDGFIKSQYPIVVICATNRVDVLDDALTRPGRLDRKVNVGYPQLQDREDILNIHAKNIVLGSAVNIRKIAQGTPGFSGAELANLVNEAALFAVKNNRTEVTMADFDEARDKIMLGVKSKSIIMSEQEKKQVAYHEAGHALVSLLLPEATPLHKVTILPRGQTLGVTHFMEEKDKYSYSKEELLAAIQASLAGRIAEEVIFSRQFTGACNDFEKATNIARSMVCEYGMSEVIGTRNCRDSKDPKVEEEIQRIIKDCYNKTRQLLTDNKKKLVLFADTLCKKETMHVAEICKLLGLKKPSKVVGPKLSGKQAAG